MHYHYHSDIQTLFRGQLIATAMWAQAPPNDTWGPFKIYFMSVVKTLRTMGGGVTTCTNVLWENQKFWPHLIWHMIYPTWSSWKRKGSTFLIWRGYGRFQDCEVFTKYVTQCRHSYGQYSLRMLHHKRRKRSSPRWNRLSFAKTWGAMKSKSHSLK